MARIYEVSCNKSLNLIQHEIHISYKEWFHGIQKIAIMKQISIMNGESEKAAAASQQYKKPMKIARKTYRKFWCGPSLSYFWIPLLRRHSTPTTHFLCYRKIMLQKISKNIRNLPINKTERKFHLLLLLQKLYNVIFCLLSIYLYRTLFLLEWKVANIYCKSSTSKISIWKTTI